MAESDSRSGPVLMTAEGAAELLSVPPTWVLAEARANRIPHIRLGPRYVRFEADELRAWWLERAQGPWRNRAGAAERAKAS